METWELERTAAQYGDTIYRVALQYTGHPCDAEDVLQDVLLECFRKQNSFTSPEHERRWLLRVTINKSKNLLRTARRHRTVPLEEMPETAAPSEPASRALYEAVLSLPRNQRLTVDLYYYEGILHRGDRRFAGCPGGHSAHLAAPGPADLEKTTEGGLG